jgi:hypothetical protein
MQRLFRTGSHRGKAYSGVRSIPTAATARVRDTRFRRERPEFAHKRGFSCL